MLPMDEFGWPEHVKILVILAHPDDPEFFLGATIAYWTSLGHEVEYLLLTRGERGVSPAFPGGVNLIENRMREQANAARVLGVHKVSYLSQEDGYLEPGMALRRDVVAKIREAKPDIVVSCDPLNVYSGTHLNHPDHRAAGQVVLDASFPAVGNPSFFPEVQVSATRVREVWLSLTNDPNVELDVSSFWEQRKTALLEHVSQIGEPGELVKRLEERRKERFGTDGRYFESFRKLVLRG